MQVRSIVKAALKQSSPGGRRHYSPIFSMISQRAHASRPLGSFSKLKQCRSVGLAAIFRTRSTSSHCSNLYKSVKLRKWNTRRHKKTIGSPKVVGWGTLWGRHLVGFLLSGTQGKPPMELIGAVVGMSQTKTCLCTCTIICRGLVCVCVLCWFHPFLPKSRPSWDVLCFASSSNLPPAQPSPRFMHRIVPWRQVAWGQRLRWRLRSPWSRGHAACSWALDDGLNMESNWKHPKKKNRKPTGSWHGKPEKLHHPKGPTIQSPSDAPWFGCPGFSFTVPYSSHLSCLALGLLENLPKSS